MNNLLFIELAPFFIGLALSWLILRRMRIFGDSGRLFQSMDINDIPSRSTIELGGLSLFPILLVALCLSMGLGKWFADNNINLQGLTVSGFRIMQVIAGCALLYVVGLKNDVHGTRDQVKFFVLLLTASMFPLTNLWIQDLQGLFGIHHITPWFGMPLTVLLAMSLTELVVLLDDIDGQGMGIVSLLLLVFGGFCVAYGFTLGTLVCAAGLGVSLPYFALKTFNPAWRKTLVGHAGTYVMGYLLTYVAISLIQQSNYSMPNGMLLVVLGVLLVPMLDVLRQLRQRVREGRPALVTDRNQMQHRLIRMGIPQGLTPLCITLVIALFATLNTVWVLQDNNLSLLALLNLMLWALLEVTITTAIRRREQHRDQQNWQIAYEQSAFEAAEPVTPIQHITLWESAVKRGFDIVSAALLLVLFSPLGLIIGLLIKLDDRGPILYRQERVGRYGRTFLILKFRSMRIDAESAGPALSSARKEDDPRLTHIGRFLRLHHLDELPQLWNVLRGDMSFIGYRPERQYYIDQILKHDSRYTQLYQIRPGVTSYATLYNGYTDTMDKMLRRLQYDLYYLEHRSLWFDFKILWTTFISILFGKKF